MDIKLGIVIAKIEKEGKTLYEFVVKGKDEIQVVENYMTALLLASAELTSRMLSHYNGTIKRIKENPKCSNTTDP